MSFPSLLANVLKLEGMSWLMDCILGKCVHFVLFASFIQEMRNLPLSSVLVHNKFTSPLIVSVSVHVTSCVYISHPPYSTDAAVMTHFLIGRGNTCLVYFLCSVLQYRRISERSEKFLRFYLRSVSRMPGPGDTTQISIASRYLRTFLRYTIYNSANKLSAKL